MDVGFGEEGDVVAGLQPGLAAYREQSLVAQDDADPRLAREVSELVDADAVGRGAGGDVEADDPGRLVEQADAE